MAVSNANADIATDKDFRNNMPTRYPHRVEPKMNRASCFMFNVALYIAYFTISKVNDIRAVMSNSPDAIGVDFSDMSIVRRAMGICA